MENPRVVSHLFLAILAISIVAMTSLAICQGNYLILLLWLPCLAGFAILCVVLATANAFIFVPIFWLMSRFTLRKGACRPGGNGPDADSPQTGDQDLRNSLNSE
jgi:hypothetical protein